MIENLIFFLISLSLMAVFFAILGGIYLFLLRKNVKWNRIIIAGFIYCTLAFSALVFFSRDSGGQNLLQYSAAEMQKNMDLTLETAKKKGASPEDLAFLRTVTEAFVIKPFAAWCVTSMAFIVFLVYFVVRLYALNRYGISDGMPPFEVWHLHESVMWGLIACLAVLVFKNMFKNEILRSAAYNGAFIFANLYFIAGISVASFMFIKFKVPGIIRLFFYIILFLWSYLMAIIILTGILDTWFNFRRLEKGGAIWK